MSDSIKGMWFATTHAKLFNFPGQGDNESDAVFRERISVLLVELKEFYKAYEAFHNEEFKPQRPDDQSHLR